MLTREAYLVALERDSTSFADIITGADLATDVPNCPGWTLHDLVLHVGRVHRWAHGAIVSGEPLDMPDGPDEPAALAGWFADGSSQLVELLASTAPDAPAWTFGPPPAPGLLLVSASGARDGHPSGRCETGTRGAFRRGSDLCRRWSR